MGTPNGQPVRTRGEHTEHVSSGPPLHFRSKLRRERKRARPARAAAEPSAPPGPVFAGGDRGAMATYINELRALIASTSTSTASAEGAGPASAHLEVKLREVLPNLLRDYVVPSPKGERAAPPSIFAPSVHVRLPRTAVGLTVAVRRGWLQPPGGSSGKSAQS
jgi:hypothetical protein